jgi:transposase
LCTAHMLRERLFLHEEHHQAWADELAPLLVSAKDLTAAARVAGPDRLDPVTVATNEAHDAHLLWQGRRANPPVPPDEAPPQPGRRKGRRQQTKAQNLLARLVTHRDAVLAFVHNLRVPFDNNQAERDLRMLKVQQKNPGGSRSAAGAASFARIRVYISTVRTQGLPVLAALETVFAGSPLLPNLAC